MSRIDRRLASAGSVYVFRSPRSGVYLSFSLPVLILILILTLSGLSITTQSLIKVWMVRKCVTNGPKVLDCYSFVAGMI